MEFQRFGDSGVCREITIVYIGAHAPRIYKLRRCTDRINCAGNVGYIMARFNYFRWLTRGSLNNIRRNLVIYCDREVIYIFYKLRFTGIYVIARIRPAEDLIPDISIRVKPISANIKRFANGAFVD